jgi:hypothetical protein
VKLQERKKGGYINRDDRGLKKRRHSSFQDQEEPILEPEGMSVSMSGKRPNIREVREPAA